MAKINYTKVRSIVAKEGGCEVREEQTDGTLGAARFIPRPSGYYAYPRATPNSPVIPAVTSTPMQPINLRRVFDRPAALHLSVKVEGEQFIASDYRGELNGPLTQAASQAISDKVRGLFYSLEQVLKPGLYLEVSLHLDHDNICWTKKGKTGQNLNAPVSERANCTRPGQY